MLITTPFGHTSQNIWTSSQQQFEHYDKTAFGHLRTSFGHHLNVILTPFEHYSKPCIHTGSNQLWDTFATTLRQVQQYFDIIPTPLENHSNTNVILISIHLPLFFFTAFQHFSFTIWPRDYYNSIWPTPFRQPDAQNTVHLNLIPNGHWTSLQHIWTSFGIYLNVRTSFRTIWASFQILFLYIIPVHFDVSFQHLWDIILT